VAPGTILLTVRQANDICANTFGPGWQPFDDLHGGNRCPAVQHVP
jgi:hypothetical protein